MDRDQAVPEATTVASGTAGTPADIPARLDRLRELSIRDLRAEWQRHYHAVPPPRLSRDLLTRGVAYKIQERAAGGPDRALTRRLAALARQMETGALSRPKSAPLRPGARLVREWHGTTHTVTVTENGFDYAGKRYQSLSQIARAITGGHWSGPRFFGLNRTANKGARVPAAEAEDV